MTDALHQQLLEAHASENVELLATLYGRAATEAESRACVDEACFFLTQAYVFALEAGAPDAAEFNRRLAHYGRDILRNDIPGAAK